MPHPALRVLSYDPEIFRLCGPLRLHARFPHAWHVRSEDRQILSVVTSTWNGPLTVRVVALPAVSPGATATLDPCGLHIGTTAFSFERAQPWTVQPARANSLDPATMRRDLEQIRLRVRGAGRGGLSAEAAKRSPTRHDATGGWLARGQGALAHLEDALARQDRDAASTHAVGLLGLGPGLTPAGDDVVSGLLAGLAVLGRRSGRHYARCWSALTALTDRIVAEAPQRTTSFSATMLRAATRGVAIEPLLHVLESMGSGAPVKGIDDVLILGHTSGSDMLTGALLAGTTLVRWEEVFGTAMVGSR